MPHENKAVPWRNALAEVLNVFSGPSVGQQIAEEGRSSRETIGRLLDDPTLSRQQRQNMLAEMSRNKMASPFMGFGVGNIKAYHGSPHDFTRFSTKNIGTGEGAQAYGHGLYFAENPSVAGRYQTALARSPGPMSEEVKSALRSLDYLGFDKPGQALTAIRSEGGRWLDMWDVNPARSPQEAKAVEVINKYIAKNPRGRLYEVNIKPDPPDFLDWDKPLSQQSEKVRKALEKSQAGQEIKKYLGPDPTGAAIHDDLLGSFMARTEGGGRALSGDAAKRAVSRLLARAGIKGYKYKDAGSRGSEKGTYNYVVFDENDIEILSKK